MKFSPIPSRQVNPLTPVNSSSRTYIGDKIQGNINNKRPKSRDLSNLVSIFYHMAGGGKSIIQRMARLYDLYRLVKTVDKVAEKMEKENPEEYLINGHYEFPEPEVFEVRRRYTKPHKWLPARSPKKVKFITSLALEKKYISKHQSKDTRLFMHVFHIEDKGWDLIQRSFFGSLPKGLLLAWAEKNSTFYNLMFGFIGGIVIASIGIIISK